MKLRLIKVKELPELIESDAFQNATDVPISPLRALSQFHNPNAEQSDIALVIAENEQGDLLSYMGCLPDQLQIDPTLKICWCSCWWSHPERGQAAAMPVFFKALECWKGQMLFDALPPHSVAILERLNFVDFIKIEGLQLSLRFKFAQALSKRIPSLSKIKGLLSLGDSLLNRVQDWRLNYLKTHQNNLTVTAIQQIDSESDLFIEEHQKKELIGRKAKQLNWILEYPWLDEQLSGKGLFSKKYFFSAHAEKFFNRVLQVKRDGKICAILFLTFRDGVVRLPYVYYSPGLVAII